MFVLIALSLLFLLTIGIAVLSWRREEALPHPYLLGGGMLAVGIIFALGRPSQPLHIPWIRWRVIESIPIQPTFLIDQESWVFSLALQAVAVGFMLMARKVDRQSVWVLGLTCAGLLGTLSGNALTLLFSWALMDLLEFGYRVQNRPKGVTLDHYVLSFSYRMVAPFLLVYGNFRSLRMGIPFSFHIFSPRIGWILSAAAILRLVFSMHPTSQQESKAAQDRQLVFSQSISAAISLLLLTRVAEMGLAHGGMDHLRLGIALILPLFGLGWITAPDPFSGRRSWMLGWLSFVSLAVIHGHKEASLAWSLSLLLSGNILFFIPRTAGLKRYIAPLFILGAGGLPLTPLWKGMILFSDGLWGVYWAFWLGIFLLGGIRFVLGSTEHDESTSVGFQSQSAVALVFLTSTHMLLAYGGGLFQDSFAFDSYGWGVLVPYVVLLPGVVWRDRLLKSRAWISDVRTTLGSLPGKFSLLILRVGSWLSRSVMGTFRLLEGRGGLIWALLGVFFLLSMLASAGGG